MTYHSRRAYPEYFEGILKGAAEYFREPVAISVTASDGRSARAEIFFTAGAGKHPAALAGGKRLKALGA